VHLTLAQARKVVVKIFARNFLKNLKSHFEEMEREKK